MSDLNSYSKLRAEIDGVEEIWELNWTVCQTPGLKRGSIYYNCGVVHSNSNISFFRDLMWGIKERLVLKTKDYLENMPRLGVAEIFVNDKPHNYCKWTKVSSIPLIEGYQDPDPEKNWCKIVK